LAIPIIARMILTPFNIYKNETTNNNNMGSCIACSSISACHNYITTVAVVAKSPMALVGNSWARYHLNAISPIAGRIGAIANSVFSGDIIWGSENLKFQVYAQFTPD